jgi:hypothetical protein
MSFFNANGPNFSPSENLYHAGITAGIPHGDNLSFIFKRSNSVFETILHLLYIGQHGFFGLIRRALKRQRVAVGIAHARRPQPVADLWFGGVTIP